MVKHIEIHTSALSSDINELTGQLQQVRNNMRTMYDSIAELNTMWEGPANDAFKAQFQIDYEMMQEVCGSVEQLISCMDYARINYDACESEVSAAVSAIKI